MPALPLEGRVVLVTGTITGLSRDEAKAAVTTLGGTAASSVTGKVDLIVLGEGAGISKEAKARSLGIAALDADTFAALAADPTIWDGAPLGMPFADYDALHAPEQAEDRQPIVIDPSHWTGKAACYVPGPDGRIERQIRLWCVCGHKWMRNVLHGDDTCPRPEVPVTVAPWEPVIATA